MGKWEESVGHMEACGRGAWSNCFPMARAAVRVRVHCMAVQMLRSWKESAGEQQQMKSWMRVGLPFIRQGGVLKVQVHCMLVQSGTRLPSKRAAQG